MGNPPIRLPTLRYPTPNAAPLGAFPTPARAIPAGKSGAYGNALIPRQTASTTPPACSPHQSPSLTPIPPALPTPTIETVENKLRAHVLAHRIRLTDFFLDFDKLRSGYVTATQFRRCLGMIMHKGIVSPMSERECEVLMEAYDSRNNRMIKWTQFVDSIDKVFGAKKLEHTPTQQILAPKEVVRPIRALAPSAQIHLETSLARLRSFVKWHGSDVKTWFNDFDKHNNGFVTKNQFRRGLPQNVLSSEEEEALIEQFSMEETVNYFKLNTEVNRKVRRRPVVDDTRLTEKNPKNAYHPRYVPVGTEELIYPRKARYGEQGPTIAQFHAGLSLAATRLTEQELSVLLSQYQDAEGRVRYRAFCGSIDLVFTMNELEKNPLVEVGPIAREDLVQGTNTLGADEEVRCQQLINRLAQLITERHLLLEPLFKDFDMYLGKNTMGRVTRSHFIRLLSTMRLDLCEQDLHILFDKFEDENGQICYLEFMRAVDPASKFLPGSAATCEGGTGISSSWTYSPDNFRHTTFMDISTPLQKIRTHVLHHRIRVSEFFRDFDKLRSYAIPKDDFIRGINRIGVPLSERDVETLVKFYAWGKGGCCAWKRFEEDIERVFGEPHLESRPTLPPAPIPVASDPFQMTLNDLGPEDEAMLISTLQALRNYLSVRQTSIKPFFKDFDKLRTGLVTKAQFRQCLAYIRCPLTEPEFTVLSKRYLKDDSAAFPKSSSSFNAHSTDGQGDYIQDNAKRICYVTFLRELEASMPAEQREQTAALPVTSGVGPVAAYATRGPAVNDAQALLSDWDIWRLMMRIKTKAKTERIRVEDFIGDFDHLRHGCVTRNEFHRALKVLFSDLTQPDLDSLSILYALPSDPKMVDYVRFVNEIESVFTKKGLERCPTEVPDTFPGPEHCCADLELTVDEEWTIRRAVDRLRRKINERRIALQGYLEDFDTVKEGTITTNQFRSVLTTLGLPLSDKEIYAIAKKFATTPALDRLDYR
ncbi:hypothetical protein DFS34DRAFT_660037, partial [Phlyctochytrium arcticum]